MRVFMRQRPQRFARIGLLDQHHDILIMIVVAGDLFGVQRFVQALDVKIRVNKSEQR